MKGSTIERLHPAVWPAALLMLISVGRLQELLPFLAPLQLGKLSVLWAAAAIVCSPRDPGNAPMFDQRLPKLMLVWFGFAAFSVLWSIWRTHSLGFLFGSLLVNLILFFVIAWTTTNTRTLRFFASTLLASGALLSFNSLVAAASGGVGRVSVSWTYDPNDLAMILVMLLPLAVAFLFALRGPVRIAVLVLCGAVLVGILLTGSRGGFLGLVVVGGYLFFARLPKPDGGLAPRFQPAKFIVLGLAVTVLVAATPATVWERLASIGSLDEDYNATASSGRVAIWSRGIHALVERPWGYGVAAFEAVEGGQGGRYKAAHNIWVEIGVELGIQGAVLLAVVLATALGILREARRQEPRAPPHHWILPVALGLRGALIGYLVTGFFLSAAYAGIIFAVLGVCAGLQNVLATVPADTPVGASGQDAPPQPFARRSRRHAGPRPVGGWRPISRERHRPTSTERR